MGWTLTWGSDLPVQLILQDISIVFEDLQRIWGNIPDWFTRKVEGNARMDKGAIRMEYRDIDVLN